LKEFSFPAEVRIRKRAEYQAVFKQGKKVRISYFTAFVRDRTDPHSRIGITVSKKVGNAVARNRIKRIIREFYRHRKNTVPEGRDISIIAGKGLTSLSNTQIMEKLDTLFTKIALA
jgi:ribonuclease P protein component